jgi:anti-anti-sigma factor
MDILKSQENDTVTLKINGKIDVRSAKNLEKVLGEQIAAGGFKVLKLDLSDVLSVSSAALRVFVAEQKKVIGLGSELILINLSPVIREVFDITGFSGLLNID